MMYYVKSSGEVSIEIPKIEKDEKQLVLIAQTQATAGFNTYTWNLKAKKYKKCKSLSGEVSHVGKGKYEIVLRKYGAASKVTLEIK